MAVKRGLWKKKTVTVVGDGDEFENTPLFDSPEELAYIAVTREDPEEGFLGKLTPNATEQDIRKKYGGGTFSLSARTQIGKPAKSGARTITIAGDPIFKSAAAEKKWKKEQGLVEPDKEKPTSEKQFGLMEMMLLLDKQAEKARIEAREFASIREREAAQAHQRQIELIQADNIRREQDIRLQSERIEKEAKEERERNREFMATILKIREDSKPTESPADASVRLLLSGIQLARELGGGGEDQDPVAGLVQKLPDILAESRRLISSDKSGESKKSDEEEVTFKGDIAKQVNDLAAKIKSQGKDPGTVFSRAFQVLSGSYSPPKKAEKPKPANVTKPKKGAKTKA